MDYLTVAVFRFDHGLKTFFPSKVFHPVKVLLTDAAWTSVKSTAGKAVTRRRIHKSQIKHDFPFFIHDFLSYRDILSDGSIC